MERSPILAAGGIVFRSGAEPLIAIVRLSKGDDWVLPKGKLNRGETPKAAAQREVWEETGFDVSVHEFLGKLKYAAGGRQKVVHFWRMEASKKVRAPMNDIKDVDWLPLDTALKRLTRGHERAFLQEMAPFAEKARGRCAAQTDSSRSRIPANRITVTDRKNQKESVRSTLSKRPNAKRNPRVVPTQPNVATNSLQFFRDIQIWFQKNLFGDVGPKSLKQRKKPR